jgi:hypothetical protein
MRSYRTVLKEIKPAAAENELFSVLVSLILRKLGLMSDEITILYPSRELQIFPNLAEIIREGRRSSIEKTLDNWFEPLSAIPSKGSATTMGPKIHECLERVRKSWRLAQADVSYITRAYELACSFVHNRNLGKLTSQESNLLDLSSYGNIFAYAISDDARLAEEADGQVVYHPYLDESSISKTLDLLARLDGKITTIPNRDIADWFSLMPVSSERPKELRMIALWPTAKTPKFDFRFYDWMDASVLHPDTFLIEDASFGNLKLAASRLNVTTTGIVSDLNENRLVESIRQSLSLSITEMKTGAEFIEFKYMGFSTERGQNELSATVDVNNETTPLALLALFLEFTDQVTMSGGSPEFGKNTLPDDFPRLAAIPSDIILSDAILVATNPKWMLVGVPERLGTSSPFETSCLSTIIGSKAYVKITDIGSPRSVDKIVLASTFTFTNEMGNEVDTAGEIRLSEVLDLPDTLEAFFFYDMAWKRYMSLATEHLSSVINSSLAEAIKTRLSLLPLTALISVSRSELIERAASLVMKGSEFSNPSQRRLTHKVARATLKVGLAASLIGQLTGTTELWQTVLSRREDLLALIYTQL